ncbi:MAG: hypothetical protein A2Z05_07255 [Chloroflexi bacterium RBG_16_60_22]|nr:MAG: hypothetical protein A2Z05_07255 [Chloroflexi bacterium RBG_16_60_22]
MPKIVFHRPGLSATRCLFIIIAFIALTNISILLNVPVLRPVLSFLLLAFLPGLLIIYILRQNRLVLTEKIVLSAGISMAFTIIFGLALNTLALAWGYDRPLSTVPLLISFGLANVILATAFWVRQRKNTLYFSWPGLMLRDKTLLILPALFPLLSILGVGVMNGTGSNWLLMLLLLLIPAYVIVITFYQKRGLNKLYPGLIYFISISLALLSLLRSNHLIGSDIHSEYNIFLTTLNNGHWAVLKQGVNVGWDVGILNSCLSISLLPAIYQSFVNINPEFLFRSLYVFIYAFLPLIIYIISSKYVRQSNAFLAAFFFMSQVLFLWAQSGARAAPALLFFNLFVLVLFNDRVSNLSRNLFAILFAAACVLSHYGITYVFLSMFVLAWPIKTLATSILSRKWRSNPRNNSYLGRPSNNIKVTLIILLMVLSFLWYSQVTTLPFETGINTIIRSFSNVEGWASLETKGSTVSAAFGENIGTIPQQIRLVTSWIIVGLIGSGVLYSLIFFRRMIAIPGPQSDKLDFLNNKFEIDYFALTLAICLIMLISLVLPFILLLSGLERLFFQALTVLAPFLIIGGTVIARWIRIRPQVLILPLLIAFFMSTTGTMYEIFRQPSTIILGTENREYKLWYVHDQESRTAAWLSNNAVEGVNIFAGPNLEIDILKSQGELTFPRVRASFTEAMQRGETITGYIYLGYNSTKADNIMNEYPQVFTKKNKIYAANGTQIYLGSN